MAANEYYNAPPVQSKYNNNYYGQQQQPQHEPTLPSFDSRPPQPPPSSLKPGYNQQNSYSQNSYSQSSHSQNSLPQNPYHQDSYSQNQYPQNSYPPKPYQAQGRHDDDSDQDTGYLSHQDHNPYSSQSVGRVDDGDQYADNIPLKNNMKVAVGQDNWQNQNTQFPSQSIESQRPPLAVEKAKRRSGLLSGRVPYVVYFLTLVQCTVFIAEIARYAVLTGSPIEIHPSFNIMIGPSTNLLINMGARYIPCMRPIPEIQNSTAPIQWQCPNSTTTDYTSEMNMCSLSEVCGFGGVNFEHPNQWFRFITPIFLHAGIIHIGVNMLMQMTMGKEMEKQIGPIRFTLVYFCSGIFGFVLGGNYAGTGFTTTGASGALFGIFGLFLLDLFYTWRERPNPMRDLLLSLVDIIISLALGLLPGVVDNFSHIGGLLMGLVMGLCILHSPNALRQRIGETSTPYQPMNPASPTEASGDAAVSSLPKKSIGFFKGRKPLWWAWWLLRAGCLVGVLVVFIVLLNNFYKYHNTCSWCKYLSCLPVKNWCDLGNLQFSNVTSKRSLFDRMDGIGYGLFEEYTWQ